MQRLHQNGSRHPAKSASERLQRLGFENVEVKNADGYYGWQEHAPFDAIIVTAASSHIKTAIFSQHKPGGVQMKPVGPVFQVQQLSMVQKAETCELNDATAVTDPRSPANAPTQNKKNIGARTSRVPIRKVLLFIISSRGNE